jgi:hypothetical protein
VIATSLREHPLTPPSATCEKEKKAALFATHSLTSSPPTMMVPLMPLKSMQTSAPLPSCAEVAASEAPSGALAALTQVAEALP